MIKHRSSPPGKTERDTPQSSHPPSSQNPWEDITYDGGAVTATQRAVASAVTAPAPRPRDRATLTVVTGPDTGKVFSLHGDVTIGRALECDIRLDDPNVSRVHARIFVSEDGECRLHDERSRNGVFVNGFRQRDCALATGDRLQFGTSYQMRFALYDQDEEQLLRHLYESSIRDTLTGAFNRHHFNERLDSEFSFAIRHHTDLALLILDIDHFKKINDTYGHLAGDTVLRSLSGLVALTVRNEDVLCRYGGEEFAVIARSTGMDGAVALAERIRAVVSRGVFSFQGVNISITVSLGVATFLELRGGEKSPSGLIARADERLYQAKANGRNCVVGS